MLIRCFVLVPILLVQSFSAMADARSGGVVSDIIAVSIEPRMELAGGRNRVVLDLTVKNKTDGEVRIDEFTIFAGCKVHTKGVRIFTMDGKAVEYTGIMKLLAKWRKAVLRPHQVIAIRNVDITDSYAFPKTAQKLRLRFDTVAAEHNRVLRLRSEDAILSYSPVKQVPASERGQEILEQCSSKDTLTIKCDL